MIRAESKVLWVTFLIAGTWGPKMLSYAPSNAGSRNFIIVTIVTNIITLIIAVCIYLYSDCRWEWLGTW